MGEGERGILRMSCMRNKCSEHKHVTSVHVLEKVSHFSGR